MEYNCDLITGEDLKKGVLSVDQESRKVYFEEKDVQSDYIASPSFFNSHIHLGDSHIKDPPYMSLEELVGPGGHKFHYVMSDSANTAIMSSIGTALSSGTSALADFREGGVEGLEVLRRVDEQQICYPLARPSTIEEGEELASDDYVMGFGLSSVRDHEEEYIEQMRKLARVKKKMFAIHAGERDPQDVEGAINLEPDVLIHMNMATKPQLEDAMAKGIPIVSCFRSNSFFGLLNLKNYRMLVDYEKWLIGTDNVMLASPSALDEMSFGSYLLQRDEEIIKAAFRGFDIFSVNPGLIVFNKKKNLTHTLRAISSVVKRGKREDIDKIFRGYDLSNLFD